MEGGAGVGEVEFEPKPPKPVEGKLVLKPFDGAVDPKPPLEPPNKLLLDPLKPVEGRKVEAPKVLGAVVAGAPKPPKPDMAREGADGAVALEPKPPKAVEPVLPKPVEPVEPYPVEPKPVLLFKLLELELEKG